MATYLQGAVDYIPQIQPFAPNLNLYANVLQTKQSKYDSNWKALNNVYSQYFYADLSREDNQKRRDELMTAIDFNLKKVSGLDLSLEQNVRQAKQLFTPFYEDKYLMKDMVRTKNYMQERQRGLSLKNSKDDKSREQYWEAGIKFLDYQMQEFKDASLEESLNFGGLSYTPFVNIQKKAMDLAKQFGNVESPSFSPDGRYMIVNRNGEQLREPLHRLFEATFGNDPAAQEMFQVMAYVNRKDYSQVNASLFGGDAKQAEMKYLQEQFENFSRIQQVEFENQQDNLRVINNFISDLEKKDAAGTLDDSGKKALREYKYSKEIIERNLERAEKLNTELNIEPGSLNSGKGFQNPYEDIETLRRKVDGAVANSLFSKQLQEAAQNYSIMNMKQTVTADPFAVIDYRHQKSKELANYKARVAKEQKAEEQRAEWEAQNLFSPSPTAPPGGSGSTDEPVSPIALGRSVMEQQEQEFNNDLTELVNMYKTLHTFGAINNENFYKLTGYRTPEAFEKAKNDGKLINDYTTFTFKNKVNFSTIFDAYKDLRNEVVSSQLPKDKWGRSSTSEWYGFNPETKKREYAVPKAFENVIEPVGKKLDDLIQGTYNYLSDNRHVSGIDAEFMKFAGHDNAIYQRHTYYRESKKAYGDWVDTHVKPLLNDLMDTKTYFNVFFGDESEGYTARNDLYRTLGKKEVLEIHLESSSEDVFFEKLERRLSEKYGKKIKFATDLGFGYNTQSGKESPTFTKPYGLYDKLYENLSNILTTRSVPPPPNIIPFGQMTSTGATGQFVPYSTSINAKASELIAPGTQSLMRANKIINMLGFDDTDTYFAFGNTITDKKEMNDKFKDDIKNINNLFKTIINNYSGSKSKDIVNVTFTPMADGSPDKHALTFTFPQNYIKDYKDNFKAMGVDENVWNRFLQNGNSFTVVAPAGSFQNVPLVQSSLYTPFEQYVMARGTNGVTYNTKFPGISYQFLYKDGGMYLIEHENGQPKVDAVTNTFYGAPGSATRAYNNLLSNGYIIL